jgi:6,7-dimethyl-8-ribityllumazine synthase
MTPSPVLIVAGDFYRDIAQPMIDGASKALENANIPFEVITVPGALEIPGAIAQAELAGADYAGYVALGCVIRGETTHYDYVCGESARGLMELSLGGVPVGNGILTVESREQAMVRAVDKNKGADAAQACMALMALRTKFEKQA